MIRAGSGCCNTSNLVIFCEKSTVSAAFLAKLLALDCTLFSKIRVTLGKASTTEATKQIAYEKNHHCANRP